MAQSYASYRAGKVFGTIGGAFKATFKFIVKCLPIACCFALISVFIFSAKSCAHQADLNEQKQQAADAASAKQASIVAQTAEQQAAKVNAVATVAPVAAPVDPSAKLVFADADKVPDGAGGDADLIMIDQETGCQYLVIRNGRLSGTNTSVVLPRLHLGADGKAEPFCRAPK
jgi:hemolysin activation/secretion protein